MIIAELTVTCSGRDRVGKPTHDRTVVADLAIDNEVGIVLKATAQQRGNPQAGRPRAFGEHLDCPLCGYRVPVGRSPHRRLRRAMRRGQEAGLPELTLHELRRALDS